MLLTELLPKRSVEDVLAERVRITLGGQEFILPTLSIAHAELWRAGLERSLAELLSGLLVDLEPAKMLAHLGTHHDVLWTLVAAYDESGVLPLPEWVREKATDIAIVRAFLEVVGASYPLVVTVLELVATRPEVITAVVERAMASMPPALTSLPPPPMAGRRKKSAAA